MRLTLGPLAGAHFLLRLWVLGCTATENSTCTDRCDRRRPRLTHDRFKFAGIDIEHSLGAFLPKSGKTPTLRSPDANARCT
jgi:hypothetical protein